MVRLSLSAFEEACKQMKTHSGIHKMRIMVKARPCNRLVSLKVTDDKVAVTSSIRGLNEMKILERILAEFVGASMINAPALPPDSDTAGQKKSKKGKKGNVAGAGKK
jgi:hypothetical protein